MIISDLNYLEEVNNETKVVGGNAFNFDKDIDVDIDTDLDFNVDVDVDKDVNVDVDVLSNANIDGNIAQLTFDVEAFGTDTLAELEFNVLAVENELSSVAGFAIAAAD